MGNTLPTLPGNPLPSPPPPAGAVDQELQPPSEDNPDFTCEICIEPTSNPGKKFKNANRCSHPFCTDCMIKYIRVKLEDDNAPDIKCPAFNCGHALDPFACAPLMGPSLFLRWCDVLCEAAISGWDRCYCPYRNCNVLIVNECGENLKKSKCPSCKRWFCFQCKGAWHGGFGCEESRGLTDGNDVAFGMLAEMRKWRRCPRCRHFVELREGCQIVKCRCRISFCYKCGKQVHQHWCRCDTTSMFRVWCFRVCIVLIFLTFAFFFLLWEAESRS